MKFEAPEGLATDSPAEALEYHIKIQIEEGNYPQDFMLSDYARDFILNVIHKLWERPGANEMITNAIYSFISGYLIGKYGRIRI